MPLLSTMRSAAPARPQPDALYEPLERVRGRAARVWLPATAAALIGAGLLAVTQREGAAWALSVAWFVGLSLLIALDIRDARRRREFDTLVLGLLPILGIRARTRSAVKLQRWTSRWGGTPARIVCRFGPELADERMGERACDVVSRRVGVPYEIDSLDERRCVMVLVPSPPAAPADPTPKAQERAMKLVADLFGAEASGSYELDAEDEVEAFEVKFRSSPKLTTSGYRHRLERVVSSMLPGRWRARWDLEEDTVRFELRPQLPGMIRNEPRGAEVAELSHKDYSKFKLVYATDEDGREIGWVPSVQPHWLIIGGTGSGKTSTQHTALTVLARAGWRVWVLDGKRIEFIGFRDWPNVEMIAQRVEDQVRMVHAAHDLMEQRYTAIEEGRASVAEFEPLAVIIDEYATFKKRVERWYRTVKQKGDPAQPPVFDLIGDIARLGRTAKVHFVLGLQRPDVTFLDGEMRDNFACRTSHGRLSPEGAKMMWDSTAIGVVRTPRGQGVGLDDLGDPVPILSHYTPDPAKLDPSDEESAQALERMRPSQTAWPRKRFRMPEVDYDLDSDEVKEITPSYSEYAAAPLVDWESPSAADASEDDEQPAAPAGAVDEPEAAPDPDLEADEEDAAYSSFDGYGEPETRSAQDLDPGDLVLLDEGLEQWAVVASIDLDVVDEDSLVLELHDVETAEETLLSVPASEQLSTRRPDTD